MIGTKLAHYEITSHLGTGGMGEVYQASDSKLGRSVAIKLLPEAFASDADRAARFEREARLLASLNHPNIAAIYGLEESGGRKLLVMELVPGETLAERIKSGPIPMDEALEIAQEIANGLEAAHEKGIIHRDLKPANVKITPDGKVKLLDFGLAKAYETESAKANLSQSPTFSLAATNAGVILGTAAYMSPEQAKGRAADARSDIWAFGVVLFEMLTGNQAFEGETIVEILGAVMKTDPAWTALPATTSPILRSLLRRCLQKDSRQRLRDIADARFQIQESLYEPISPAVVAPAPKNRERLLWVTALLLIGFGVAGTMVIMSRGAATEAHPMRLQINTPPGNPAGFAVSPDGHKIVFEATTQGKRQLWLRPLDSDTAAPLAGTETGSGRQWPFWSPDSTSIGFSADQKLNRIPVSGGVAQPLADSSGLGGAWSRKGVVLFPTSGFSGLYQVPMGGGKPVQVTQVVSPQASHRYPNFLPDDRHFLFFVTGTPEVTGLYLGDLESKVTSRLVDADTSGVFAPPDFVLFARQETLYAQKLDLKTLLPVGDPFPVVDRVMRDSSSQGSLAVSASAAGPLVYRAAGNVERQLIWFNHSGEQLGAMGEPDAALQSDLSLSPDGRNAAVVRTVKGNQELWLMELARGLLRPFTTDRIAKTWPIWSPDGRQIAFSSYRKGRYDLYEKAVSGGAEKLLLESTDNKNIFDWSPDGNFILYAVNSNDSPDLWALPLQGKREPFAVTRSSFSEIQGRFSPDGHWVAYQSDESGQFEAYVQPFPEGGAKFQISTNGGILPRWRGDGRELFYIALDNHLMAVPVTLNHSTGTVVAGKPVVLFATRPESNYAVTPDGQRFLLNTSLTDVPTSPITIFLNWTPALK